jgi:hypothetical protein
MKEMDYNGLTLCKIQASLFENYSNFSSCSFYVFVRRFMNSELAERFDDTTILLDASSNKTFIDELNHQYGITKFGQNTINKEIMYWVGYIYRYWSYIYEVPSNVLFRHVQPKQLIDRYYVFHSMDPKYAIDRICEEDNISIQPNKTLDEALNEYIKFIKHNK